MNKQVTGSLMFISLLGILIMLISISPRKVKSDTNSQLKAMYEKVSNKMEFNSSDYSFTNYEGSMSISWPTDSCCKVSKPSAWPMGSQWVKICNMSKMSTAGFAREVNIASLGDIVRLC